LVMTNSAMRLKKLPFMALTPKEVVSHNIQQHRADASRRGRKCRGTQRTSQGPGPSRDCSFAEVRFSLWVQGERGVIRPSTRPGAAATEALPPHEGHRARRVMRTYVRPVLERHGALGASVALAHRGQDRKRGRGSDSTLALAPPSAFQERPMIRHAASKPGARRSPARVAMKVSAPGGEGKRYGFTAPLVRCEPGQAPEWTGGPCPSGESASRASRPPTKASTGHWRSACELAPHRLEHPGASSWPRLPREHASKPSGVAPGRWSQHPPLSRHDERRRPRYRSPSK